ncbi:uncharacterized protein LOC143884274 [Tasmannia lanceolata]|uniref:uncharacterized protein LOC143884274 n=1 Tax=Tasmannia lanceolata TaxID=3420 RepID=UPI0040640C00
MDPPLPYLLVEIVAIFLLDLAMDMMEDPVAVVVMEVHMAVVVIQGGGRGSGSRYCTHCHMEVHTIDYCYDLHPELRPYQSTIASVVTSDSQPLTLLLDMLLLLFHLLLLLLLWSSETLMVDRAEYEELVHLLDRGKQPTTTFAQLGCSSCFLSSDASRLWLNDSGASHHMTGPSVHQMENSKDCLLRPIC